MNPEFMGIGRTYQAGRSTEGWTRGKHVERLDELPNGTLIISVSHAFQAENLAIVTEQRPNLPGVWANWADVDGTVSDRYPFCIHEFVLEPERRIETEYFLALPGSMNHPNNKAYRDLAQFLVDHNDTRRAYASEMLEDQEADEPLQIHFNANTKVITDDEGKGAYVTCSVWVPNPNYEEKENT